MTAEGRVVELEWPSQMRLGDSEIIRISLIPSQHGYTITTEFSEHQTLTNTVDVQRPTGYDIYAIGRLDAIGFDSSPASEQTLALPVDMPIHMRWTLSPHTAGQHRVATSLTLRWIPTEDNLGQSSEKMIFSKGLTINVIALLGMTTTQAITTGIMGLLAGSGLGMVAMASRKRLTRLPIHSDLPNSALVIEPRPGIQIQTEDETLLRTLFRRYGRLIVETEFLSGYSGARTLLTLPIRLDGRADAYTIAKLGDRASIEQEFSNYERFVKNTLPPITARIQEPPVIAAKEGISRLKRANAIGSRAVLRYTFIGEPGRHPISLREALLNDPDPTFLNKLFSTFGPNWWMQRRPYTFRLAQEYDRVLPAHFVIQPDKGAGKILDAHGAYGNRPWESIVGIGGHVTMHGFDRQELRMDGSSLSVSGNASNGQPALRVRWLSIQPPNGASGRIMSDRTALLRQSVYGFELFGLPDPLLRLPEWLNESVQGAQSTIHGDLNLENILVGPGGFVWLIDFAQTRDGHVLYDFAHLEAEIIAQVITRQVTSPLSFLEMLQNTPHPLLTTLHAIASNCVSNPTSMREYHLALCLACIGALKYGNQQANARHHLYLTAAHLSTLL